MSLLNYLQTIATGMPSGIIPLISGTTSEQNVDVTTQFPRIYVDEPLTSTHTLTSVGTLQTVYNLRLFFATQAVLDHTPAQQQTLIEAMRNLARQFIIAMQTATYPNGQRVFNFSTGSLFRMTDVINLRYDDGLTGVYLEIDVPMFDYSANC